MASEFALCLGGQRAAGARVESACEVFSQEWDVFTTEIQATNEGLINSGMPVFAEALGEWSLAFSDFSSNLMAYGLSLSAVDDRVEHTELDVVDEFTELARRLGIN